MLRVIHKPIPGKIWSLASPAYDKEQLATKLFTDPMVLTILLNSKKMKTIFSLISITIFISCGLTRKTESLNNKTELNYQSNYDTTDCNFAFGLEKAIACAEIADDISAYKEEWPKNTNSTLFFERIKNNQHLKEINFCFVHIDSIPVSIGTVTNLEIFHIGGGTITTIPMEIGKLKHLKELSFGTKQDECGGNKITSVPKEIGQCESLEFLGLAYSAITELPVELSNCQNLKTIDLYKNQGVTIEKLNEFKTRFPKIEFISHLE